MKKGRKLGKRDGLVWGVEKVRGRRGGGSAC